jgi:hypothetical protein
MRFNNIKSHTHIYTQRERNAERERIECEEGTACRSLVLMCIEVCNTQQFTTYLNNNVNVAEVV